MPIAAPPPADSARPRRRDLVRAFVNAWNLATPLGLAVAGVGQATVSPGPRGLWLAEGYRLKFPLASAFTVGNVLITPSDFTTLGPQILAHEEAHTWQWFWLGPLFLPAYSLAMGWSWLRTGDRAARNFFERNAGLARGGYVDVPLRRAFWSRG